MLSGGCLGRSIFHCAKLVSQIAHRPLRAPVTLALLLGLVAGVRSTEADEVGENLTAVWGSAANDVWAVGSGVTYHWDGSHWDRAALTSVYEPPGHGAQLQSVWGTGPSNVWTVGSPLEFRRWDGRSWTHVPSETAVHAASLWGSGPNDVWGAGATLEGGVFHWDGAAWSWQVLESSTGPSAFINGVWGSGPKDVWAVGGGKSGAGPVEARVFHWDGERWKESPTGVKVPLQAIWGSGPSDVWAVGRRGTIAHWDGRTWATSAAQTTAMLWSLWGSGSGSVWVVGEAGTLLHWNGAVWSSVPSPTQKTLRGVWGSSPDDVWAVGQHAIVHLPSPQAAERPSSSAPSAGFLNH